MIRATLLFLLAVLWPLQAVAGPPVLRETALPDVVALQRGWGWTMCSGVVIGPDLVLTAAGCLFDTGARLPREDITVVPGLHAHGAPTGPNPKPTSRFAVRAVHIPAELHRRIRRFGFAPTPDQLRYVAPLDIAVLEIHSPRGRPAFDAETRPRPVAAISEVMADTDDPTLRLPLEFTGYATDRQADAQFSSTCDTLTFRGRLIVTDCLSDRSMAGGPLARRSDGAVFGVNYGSKLDDSDTRVAGTFAPVRDYMAPAINGLIARVPIPTDVFHSYDLEPNLFIGIDVWNRCTRTAGVAIRTLQDDGGWTTSGFFDVPAGGFRSLPIRSDNTVLYWTAYRHGDTYFRWRGNAAQIAFKGAELDMLRLDAPEHWHDIRLTLECPD